MDKTDRQVIDELNGLINGERKFKQARNVFDEYCDATDDAPHSADFYFIGTLLQNLLNGDPEPYMVLARYSEGYTLLMEGDYLRDTMLRYIRQGDFIAAELLINEIRVYHRGDDNRLAVLEMAIGRLAFARGHYKEAVSAHLLASAMWVRIRANHGKVNEQWWINNSFHGYRAAMAAHDSEAAEEEFLGDFLDHEPFPSGRRKRVTAFALFGRPAVQVDRLLERIHG